MSVESVAIILLMLYIMVSILYACFFLVYAGSVSALY